MTSGTVSCPAGRFALVFAFFALLTAMPLRAQGESPSAAEDNDGDEANAPAAPAPPADAPANGDTDAPVDDDASARAAAPAEPPAPSADQPDDNDDEPPATYAPNAEPPADEEPLADIGAFADEFDDIDEPVEPEASVGDDDAPPESTELTTTILGSNVARRRIAGSAHTVDAEQLEREEHDDVHAILKKVPGVYLRDEDGFGLRPNIGLRGANSDRSAKVTLMEDGVLLGPAPYSAPAAYYFPLVTRMTRIEVFKGPAAIQYGPQTVGGAINMITRRVPYSGHTGAFDLAGGAYQAGKGHAYYGYGSKCWGVLVEGALVRHGGFKQLDGGGPTGFHRGDTMLKLRFNTPLANTFVHRLDLKLGLGIEDSRATYLGISVADFRHNANRRYVASSLGRMQWWRTQFQARYTFSWGEHVTVATTAYRNDMRRAWRKFNRFRAGPDAGGLLKNPQGAQSQLFLRVLRGEEESGNDAQALMIGTNDRRFTSQGVQSVAHFRFRLWRVEQDIEVGVRLHQDQIDRVHDEQAFLMRRDTQGDAGLVPGGAPINIITRNHGDTLAGALYLFDEISAFGLVLTPGLRVEAIRTSFYDDLAGSTQSALRFAYMPGLGASYTLLDTVSVFGGVHKGFSPVTPGQPAEVQPEDSINAEGGGRLSRWGVDAELIGFFNRYANLTGACTFSSGCQNDLLTAQFNGGEAWVYGLEARAHFERSLGKKLAVGTDATYTLTLTQFRSDFTSGFVQFGRVEAGDELPYVPTHQGAYSAFASAYGAEVYASLTYVGPMREVAGQGDTAPGDLTDAQIVIDGGASYRIAPGLKMYFRVDNLLNQRAIVSRRPFGARPNKPLSFMLGLKVDFDDLSVAAAGRLPGF